MATSLFFYLRSFTKTLVCKLRIQLRLSLTFFVGVTAYHYALPLIANSLVGAASGIMAAEAYHAGAVRALLLTQPNITHVLGAAYSVPDITAAIAALRTTLTNATSDSGILPPGANCLLPLFCFFWFTYAIFFEQARPSWTHLIPQWLRLLMRTAWHLLVRRPKSKTLSWLERQWACSFHKVLTRLWVPPFNATYFFITPPQSLPWQALPKP